MLLPAMWFHAWSCPTVTPYLDARPESVSPLRTVWVTAAVVLVAALAVPAVDFSAGFSEATALGSVGGAPTSAMDASDLPDIGTTSSMPTLTWLMFEMRFTRA